MTRAADANLLLRVLSPSLPLHDQESSEAASTLLMRHNEAFRSHLAQAIARSLHTERADVLDIYYSMSICAVFAYCNPVPFTSATLDGAEQLLKSLIFRCKLLICSDAEVFDADAFGVPSVAKTVTTLIQLVQYVNCSRL